MDFVGVGGLGQIVEGAELHRGHGGGDVAVAGQDDAARIGPALVQLAITSRPLPSPSRMSITAKARRRRASIAAMPSRHGLGRRDLEAPRFHGPRQPGQERACRRRRSAGTSRRSAPSAVMFGRYDDPTWQPPKPPTHAIAASVHDRIVFEARFPRSERKCGLDRRAGDTATPRSKASRGHDP